MYWNAQVFPKTAVCFVELTNVHIKWKPYITVILWQINYRILEHRLDCSLFAWAYLPNLPAIQQCFSLTINQPTIHFTTLISPTNKDVGLCGMKGRYAHPFQSTAVVGHERRCCIWGLADSCGVNEGAVMSWPSGWDPIFNSVHATPVVEETKGC